MRRFFQVKHILLITALFTTDCTCQVNKEIESFVKLPVHIPYQEMDQRVCSMYADSLSTGKTLRLVNYIVSLDCSTCALSHMAAAENLMKNQDELKGVKSVYVIETSSKEAAQSILTLAMPFGVPTLTFLTIRCSILFC